MKFWRISNYADLSGIGGTRFSARWHTKGNPVIYTAEHPAGALSEFLVHLDREDIPDRFQLLTVEIDDGVNIQQIKTDQLPDGWIKDNRLTRSIGDKWLSSGSSLLLRVPSAIISDAYNVLINPAHGDAAKMRIAKVAKVPLDERLI
jgi:RES domain-containing protein